MILPATDDHEIQDTYLEKKHDMKLRIIKKEAGDKYKNISIAIFLAARIKITMSKSSRLLSLTTLMNA